MNWRCTTAKLQDEWARSGRSAIQCADTGAPAASSSSTSNKARRRHSWYPLNAAAQRPDLPRGALTERGRNPSSPTSGGPGSKLGLEKALSPRTTGLPPRKLAPGKLIQHITSAISVQWHRRGKHHPDTVFIPMARCAKPQRMFLNLACGRYRQGVQSSDRLGNSPKPLERCSFAQLQQLCTSSTCAGLCARTSARLVRKATPPPRQYFSSATAG